MSKLQLPLKKVTPLFPSNPPLKLRSCQAPPFFEIWLEAQTPTPTPLPSPHLQNGGCTLCKTSTWISHMNEHRFNHNFNNCINPLCTCSLDDESTIHYSLHCDYYNSAITFLLNDLNSVDSILLNLSDLVFFSMVLLSLMTLKMHLFWIQVWNMY